MKKTLFGILFAVGASVVAVGSAHAENAMYSCTDPGTGTVSLTNLPQGQCEQLFTYTAPVEARAPAAAVARAPAQAAAGIVGEVAARQAESLEPTDAATQRPSIKPLIAQRRDDAIAQARAAYAAGQPSAVGNPATIRRYLMTNRVEYQRALGMIP
jgi:hypothetical protein